MSSYFAFLQKLVALGTKAPQVIAILTAIAAKFQELVDLVGDVLPAAGPDGSLSLTESSLTADEEALESQVLALLAGDTSETSLAVRDGSKLRAIFQLLQVIGPMLPTLLALIPK